MAKYFPEFINYCEIHHEYSRASRSSRFSKWRQPQTRLIISLLRNVISSLNLDCFELRFIISILIPVVNTSVSSTKYKQEVKICLYGGH